MCCLLTHLVIRKLRNLFVLLSQAIHPERQRPLLHQAPAEEC